LAVLSGLKGIFWPLFGSKIETEHLSIFDGFFFTGSDEIMFWGTQKQTFALTDEQFSNIGRSKRPKRGVLAVSCVKN
jgi:hypothetical protein